MPRTPISKWNGDEPSRWRFIGWYLAISAPLHLSWEFAQMPLYEVWQTGTSIEIAYDGLHCTIGDLMIAAASLLLSVMMVGREPSRSTPAPAVLLAALSLGFGYTILSEWRNVFVAKTWAYSDLMPLLPGTGIGLGPLFQWLLIPTLGFWIACRLLRGESK